MAITQTIEHTTGDILTHWVIEDLHIQRKRGLFILKFGGYETPTRYNNGNTRTIPKTFELTFAQLPTAVSAALATLKDAVEDAAIDLAPFFSEGIAVNDDGSPRV